MVLCERHLGKGLRDLGKGKRGLVKGKRLWKRKGRPWKRKCGRERWTESVVNCRVGRVGEPPDMTIAIFMFIVSEIILNSYLCGSVG